MAVSTAQVGNLSITTQVLPAGENNVPGLPSAPTWTQMLAQKKKHPYKSLGAVIILIGVLQLCIGGTMYLAERDYPSFLSRSGAPFWGGVAFIAIGIITVVFASKEGIVKIRICLTAYLINAMLATIEIILYAIQLYKESQACWVNTSGFGHNHCIPGNSTTSRYDDYDYRYSSHWSYEDYIYSLRVSLISMILFYVVFGFAISVSILILRWKSFKETRYSLLGN